jgi:hypothetical protein
VWDVFLGEVACVRIPAFVMEYCGFSNFAGTDARFFGVKEILLGLGSVA